jgi:hypothetical protein
MENKFAKDQEVLFYGLEVKVLHITMNSRVKALRYYIRDLESGREQWAYEHELKPITNGNK